MAESADRRSARLLQERLALLENWARDRAKRPPEEPEKGIGSLCLACAAVSDAETPPSTCPHCGSPVDSLRLESILIVAKDCSTFGHHYRSRYETSGTSCRFSLSIDPIWTLVAVATAALNGIIGNTSHDVFRAAVRRILDTVGNRSTAAAREKVEELLVNEDALATFSSHIRDYLDGLPGIAPSVKAAINEEIIVHELTAQMGDFFRRERVAEQLLNGYLDPKPQGSPPDPILAEEIEEMISRAWSRVQERRRMASESQALFADLWPRLKDE